MTAWDTPIDDPGPPATDWVDCAEDLLPPFGPPATDWVDCSRPVRSAYVTATEPGVNESGYIGPSGYGEIATYFEFRAAGDSVSPRITTITRITVAVPTNGIYALGAATLPGTWVAGPTTVAGLFNTGPGTPLSYVRRGAVNQLGGVLLLGTLIHTFAPGTSSWDPPGGIVLTNGQRVGLAKIVGQTTPLITVTVYFTEATP